MAYKFVLGFVLGQGLSSPVCLGAQYVDQAILKFTEITLPLHLVLKSKVSVIGWLFV